MTVKYKPVIDKNDRANELYNEPSKEVFDAVRKEREMRKTFKKDLNEEKSVVGRKVSKKQKIEGVKKNVPKGKAPKKLKSNPVPKERVEELNKELNKH